MFVVSSKCLGFFLRMNLWGKNVLFCHLQKPLQPQCCGLCRVALAEVCIFRGKWFFCCFYLILAKFRSLWKIWSVIKFWKLTCHLCAIKQWMSHPRWASENVSSHGYRELKQTFPSSSLLPQAEVKLQPETEKGASVSKETSDQQVI